MAAAAEKLEKAAEEERQIAKEANKAAEKEGLKSDQAAGLEKKNEEATDTPRARRRRWQDSVPKADEEVKQALEK